ncbi:MAG: S1C family serine protease [Planctomycetaceae bacterium]
MSTKTRCDVLSRSCLFGAVAAGLFLAGQLSATAAEAVGSPPTLAMTRSEPLPESLRKIVPESVEELRAIEKRVRSLIADLRAVTVGVRRGPAQGSGVIVSKDGYVLTAAHVSGPPGRPVTLILNDGTTLDAVSMGCDTELDAGLVKITDRGTWPVAEVADPRDLEVGDWVIGTGHPGGFDDDRLPVIRLGRIIAKMKWILHTDVILVGGDSGGPLFDLNGRVVGIHSRIGPGAELNFQVPINAFAENWHWMLASEQRPVERGSGGPMLGVDGEDVRNGCRVTRVTAETPAAQAGLKSGDVIQQIDRRFILNLEDLIASVNQYDPGDVVTITYRRDGETQSARVTLAERPARRERRDERGPAE